jgi:protein-disulfide isomerase
MLPAATHGAKNLKNNSYFLAGLIVVALIVVGAGGWWWLRPAQKNLSSPAAAADLMTPGPLGENVLGKEDAPVTIIEYASTTCPACGHFHKTTFPELKKRYIDTGKVRFIFREFPRDDVDLFAYMLTRCIAKDKFFPFLEVLFKQQDQWLSSSPLPALTGIAKQAGFTDESIEACRNDKKVFEGVVWTSEHATKLGVRATPTFFINGKMYTGALSIERIEELIAPLLKG